MLEVIVQVTATIIGQGFYMEIVFHGANSSKPNQQLDATHLLCVKLQRESGAQIYLFVGAVVVGTYAELDKLIASSSSSPNNSSNSSSC